MLEVSGSPFLPTTKPGNSCNFFIIITANAVASTLYLGLALTAPPTNVSLFFNHVFLGIEADTAYANTFQSRTS